MEVFSEFSDVYFLLSPFFLRRQRQAYIQLFFIFYLMYLFSEPPLVKLPFLSTKKQSKELPNMSYVSMVGWTRGNTLMLGSGTVYFLVKDRGKISSSCVSCFYFVWFSNLPFSIQKTLGYSVFLFLAFVSGNANSKWSPLRSSLYRGSGCL